LPNILAGLAQAVAKNPPKTEEGQQLVKDVTKAEQKVTVKQSSAYFNLVDSLEEGKAREIAKEIQLGFKTDEESRKEWLDMHEFWLRLYMQTDSAQNSDPERSWGATESIPILTEACDQFQGRTYKAFFPSKQFVGAVPTRHTLNPQLRKADRERSERISRHMSWQLGSQNKNFRKDKRALFLAAAVHGSFFTKTYFDILKNIPRVDNVRPVDLVIDHQVGPRRIEEVRRKSHKIYTTVGDTEVMVQKGFLFKSAEPNMGGDDNYNTAVNEAEGTRQGIIQIKRCQPTILVEQQFYLDIDDSNQFLPYIGTIDLARGELLRLCIDFDATPEGVPTRDYEQIQYYTHYKFSENPDGFYGLGLGHKIGDLNSAINIGTRQMLDAGTLANDGNSSGFISERLCQDGEEEVSLTLGKFKKIPDSAGDLQSGIMQMKFLGPSQALGELLEKLDQRAQRIGSTTDATTGSTEKVEQPTTVLAKIEQAMQMFSSVQMGIADSFNDELDKLYKINQKHLPLVEYFTINDTAEQITRMDYMDDMVVETVFDPKMATQQQKIARAQLIVQLTLQNPVNQQRPQVVDAAFRRALEALDEDNIEELIPSEKPPVNIDNQVQENMAFLMPMQERPNIQVFPEHNHQQHLAELEPFILEKGSILQPDQIEMVVSHKMKHEAILYGQQMGIVPQGAQNGEAQLGGIGGMAQQPSNQMGLGAGQPGIPQSNIPPQQV
jgi:hypothetical protein